MHLLVNDIAVRFFEKFCSYINMGGIVLPGLILYDKLSGGRRAENYHRWILEKVKSEEYPYFLKELYRIYTGKKLNLDNPISYNEKIQWLKIYDLFSLKTRLTDKYLAREWVANMIGDQYLIPLLGTWNSLDEIDFELLPNAFILKCNHGCNFNILVRDKAIFDKATAKIKFDTWMKCNYAFYTLELQYRDIKPRIIAEEYIEQSDGALLDFKIHVFNGEPKIIQVIGDRNIEKHTAKEIFMTTEWIPQNLMYHTYEMYDTIPEKPINLNEMLDIARILGADFRYVRVDLYNIDGQIKFGEMTFTPASGYGKWDGDEQYLVGSWIDLS